MVSLLKLACDWNTDITIDYIADYKHNIIPYLASPEVMLLGNGGIWLYSA